MANLFSSKSEFGGAFKANEMVLTFAGFGGGYLITQVQAGYQFEAARLRELGSTRTYYVQGDGQGTVNLTRVTGPARSITALVNAYSDVCGIPQNVITLSFAPGSCGLVANEPNLTFEGVLLNGWNLAAASQGQAGIVNTTLSGTFESLDSGESEGGLSGALNTASNTAGAAGA